MDTSTNIIRRLNQGSSNTAWRQFYGRYRDLVRGVAQRSGLSEADQDEVLQETRSVQLAIIPRFGLPQKPVKEPETPREWFKQHYQVVTPETADAAVF